MFIKIRPILNIAPFLFAVSACTLQIASPGTITPTLTARPTLQPELIETEDAQSQDTSAPGNGSGLATCTEPVNVDEKDGLVSYKDIAFRVDPALGLHFTVIECEAGPAMTGWGLHNYPAYTAFTAETTMLTNQIKPELKIYTIAGNLQDYTYPLNSLDELKKTLDRRPEPSPWYAGAALHTNEKYLDSHYGIGVRGLVEFYQDIFFWTNNYLEYTYNGLTDDGRYFVSASFPIKASFLLDIQGADPLTNINTKAIPIPGWPNDINMQSQIIDHYNQEALRRFESSAPDDFLPNVELYDNLVQSLQVGVQSPASSPSEVACFSAADILSIAFMPDSASLLVREAAGIWIINLDSLQEERFLQVPKGIFTAALSLDGETLAWSLDDNTIQFVRIADQKIVNTLAGHSDVIFKLRFSPDGSQLVSSSHDRSVRVWNLQGEELRSFQPPGEALGIGVSPDGTMLATVPFDGPVALWDLNTLQKIKDLSGTGGYDTSDAVFSPDGQYLAADLATGLYLWRISDGKLIWDEKINSMAIAFSPDGRYLAYDDINDNNKMFISTADSAEILHTMEGGKSFAWEVAFSPDSQLLASTEGTEIRIWRVEDGSLVYIGKPDCP